MHSMRVCYFVLVASALIKADTEDCATPNATEGKCTVLEDCDQLKSLTKKHNLTTEEVKFIADSQCYGDVPKVCCEISNKTTEKSLPDKLPKQISLEPRSDEIENPFPTECGQSDADDRIVFGEIAGIDEFPWMAQLKYKTREGEGYGCGGSLINKRYILTAAHCITGILGNPIEVRLGEYDTNTDRDCVTIYSDELCADPVQDIGIDKIIIHPQYLKGPNKKLHDIALLRLKEPAKYSEFVGPICMPNEQIYSRLSHIAVQSSVAGWGKTETANHSNIKKKATIPVVDRKICSRGKKHPLAETQLCAGGGKEDSCNGDSGGPLMSRDHMQRHVVWHLTGLVSYGHKNCGTVDIPAVYTNVLSYLPWIKEHVQQK